MAPPDTYPIQKAMSEQLVGQGPPSPSPPPAPDEWIRRLGTLPLMQFEVPGAAERRKGSRLVGLALRPGFRPNARSPSNEPGTGTRDDEEPRQTEFELQGQSRGSRRT
jgi:hypothetical protein